MPFLPEAFPWGCGQTAVLNGFGQWQKTSQQPGAPAPEKHSGGDRPLGEQEGIPAVLRESFTERMRPWWARFTAWVKRIWAPVWKRLRKFISVPFLVMLLLSFTLWYAIKLGYTYQAEIPVLVNVDGHVFEVNCMVEGQGTRLFTKRHSKGKPLELSWSDFGRIAVGHQSGVGGHIALFPAECHLGTQYGYQFLFRRADSRDRVMTRRVPLKVGVTGGIGSGKSTVCRLFAMLGVPVYDSDAGAKRLMSSDPALIAAIRERFGAASYRDGVLDRRYLASQVFSSPVALAALNGVVHPAVRSDFRRWAGGSRCGICRGRECRAF